MYDYIADILGWVSNSNQNSTVLYIAGFLCVMTFIISADLIINGLFSFFTVRDRRKNK